MAAFSKYAARMSERQRQRRRAERTARIRASTHKLIDARAHITARETRAVIDRVRLSERQKQRRRAESVKTSIAARGKNSAHQRARFDSHTD